MIRFCPLAAARCSTLIVAIIVTAMPVTRVCGSPALNVSRVSVIHGMPTCALMRSTISCAVGALLAAEGFATPCAKQGAAEIIAAKIDTAVFIVRSRALFFYFSGLERRNGLDMLMK